MPTELDKFSDILANAQRLVVSTGAGISKESGIPTFRDAHDGLWAQYDPMELATPYGFQANPALVWNWYQYRLGLVQNTEPNPGHYALVELENLLPQCIIITQNIDDLHNRAGSSDIIPLHGSIHRYKCFDDCNGTPTIIDITTVDESADDGPPVCPFCDSAYARPDVVWFTEGLPQENIYRAQQVSLEADVMLVVGTSGTVQPAASLPYIAKRRGATILEVNPVPSGITEIATVRLAGPSGEMLPAVVEKLKQILQK